MKNHDFTIGVNYWPQRTAMFMWRHFDPATVKEDMAAIAALGCSCVRIFLLWEDFQPHPRQCAVVMLDRLVKFMELAGDCKLGVIPTLFTGYAAGLRWLPPWMLLASADPGGDGIFSLGGVHSLRAKNPYEDVEVLEAELYFLRELTNALVGHPALFAWDLGNEPFRWAIPPDEIAVSIWFQAMSETLRDRTGSVPITLGLGPDDLEAQPKLTLLPASRYLDYLSIHVYPCRLSWAGGPLDPGPLPFVGSMTHWLTDKPVLLQEFGVPTAPMLKQGRTMQELPQDLSLVDEEGAARFAEKSLGLARRFGMIGAFWGCYGDYHPITWSQPPLDRNANERFLGLLRDDGSPKPVATVFGAEIPDQPQTDPTSGWLDIDAREFLEIPTTHLPRLYRRFRDVHAL
jgi:endo-1,4-beta-mannosidase